MRQQICKIVTTVVLTVVAVLLVSNLSLGNKPLDAPVTMHFTVADSQFERAIGSVLTPALVPGNRVDELINGDRIFPRMLNAIRSARRSITLETYIYFSGDTGGTFSDALSNQAANGVQVLVLLDWVGGELDDELLEKMRASGVKIQRYNAPRWYNLGRFNNRTHRKLMIVDGELGFIGGVGLADKWSGNAQDSDHWRDTHFVVQGPVVAQMQSAFMDNWLQTTGEALQSVDYFPALEEAGSLKAQVFNASPAGGAKNMQLLYMMSIAAAAHSINLSVAYFLPDEVAIQAFVSAARRGVRIRIIVPGPHMDMVLVRHASRATWRPLLEAGVEIYEYQPTMFHCKVLVVDALWSSVGSSNFDSRSFSVNDEANMNVYDANFARRQELVFEHDLQQSLRVTLVDWRDRSHWTKILDWSATLLRSQL